MMNEIPNTYSYSTLYDINGFKPAIIDRDYLYDLGIRSLEPDMINRIKQGSIRFSDLFNNGKLYPKYSIELVDYAADSELVVQDYTGVCPKNVFMLNPADGCYFSCLYCLAIDDDQPEKITVYKNYHQYVRRHLELQEMRGNNIFYYLSPVTDPFQNPLVETGVAHNIINEFVRHYEKFPESKQYLYISTKASPDLLRKQHNGNSILDLLAQLPHKRTQLNVSIGIMPLIDIFEPWGAPIEDRLKTIEECQSCDINAYSVLMQPLFDPFLTEDKISDYFSILTKHNVTDFKPEFATISLERLGMLAQIVGYFDKDSEKSLYKLYTSPDNQPKGNSGRIAPERVFYHDSLVKLKRMAELYGLNMTLCLWIRKYTRITAGELIIPREKRSFPCL